MLTSRTLAALLALVAGCGQPAELDAGVTDDAAMVDATMVDGAMVMDSGLADGGAVCVERSPTTRCEREIGITAPVSPNPALAAHPDSGVVFVGGVEAGVYELGGATYETSHETAFIARVDGDGVVRWARVLGAEGAAVASDVITSAGSIWVAGGYQGVVDFGIADPEPGDLFVLELDLDGAPLSLWTFASGSGPASDGPARYMRLAPARDGQIFVAGSYGPSGQATGLDGHPLSPVQQPSMLGTFVARLDRGSVQSVSSPAVVRPIDLTDHPDGAMLLALATTGSFSWRAIEIGADGSLGASHSAGQGTHGALAVRPDGSFAVGGDDAVLRSFGSDGLLDWRVSFYGTGSRSRKLEGVLIDPAGSSTVTGHVHGALGAGSCTPEGECSVEAAGPVMSCLSSVAEDEAGLFWATVDRGGALIEHGVYQGRTFNYPHDIARGVDGRLWIAASGRSSVDEQRSPYLLVPCDPAL